MYNLETEEWETEQQQTEQQQQTKEDKMKTLTFFKNNESLPSTKVLSVDNGILYLQTTLETGEITYSQGFLDNIDLPTINKDKTLDELVMNNFHPMYQRYPELHTDASIIVSNYIAKSTVNRSVKVKFTLPNLKLARNPITIDYWGINQSQKETSDLGDDLVTMGFAHDWLGGPRQKWTKAELLHIIHNIRGTTSNIN